VLDAEHGEADGLFVHGRGFTPIGDAPDGGNAVIGEHPSHAFCGTLAPAAYDDAAPAALQLRDMGRGRLEDVDAPEAFRFAALLRALGRKVAAGPAARIRCMDRIRCCER
jgi:hypothetical protein